MIQGIADKITGRKVLIVGALAGFAMTVAISVMMDVMASTSGNMQGTWRDAISHDMKAYLSIDIPPGGALAWALFLMVMLVVGGIGAAMGAVCFYFIYRILGLLSS